MTKRYLLLIVQVQLENQTIYDTSRRIAPLSFKDLIWPVLQSVTPFSVFDHYPVFSLDLSS